MTELTINSFNNCQQCGNCCKTPCDLIPSDLLNFLNHFNISISELLYKYFIALIIASPKFAEEILMIVPVKVDNQGNRINKYLADNEYLNIQGNCIFLKDKKCSINTFKPFGGLFLQCSKITKSVPIQLSKDQYFAYWVYNQHIFEVIFPGYLNIYNELKPIYEQKNKIMAKQGKTPEYNNLDNIQRKIIEQKLYPLFNNSLPVGGMSCMSN